MIKLTKGYWGWGFSIISDTDLNAVAQNSQYYQTKEEALKAVGHLAQLIDDSMLADDSNHIEVCQGAQVHHVTIG